jgi:hypothetical protein
MKFFVSTIIGLTLVGSLVAYASNTNTDSPAPKLMLNKVVNASDVVKALKKNNLPIGDELVYTAENDPDKMMGQTGQYTSKVHFIDTTQQEDTKVVMLNGGTVEMFENNNDAVNRINNISKLAKLEPMYDEYDYVQGKILLRLSKNLPSTHAKKYEDALKKIAH